MASGKMAFISKTLGAIALALTLTLVGCGSSSNTASSSSATVVPTALETRTSPVYDIAQTGDVVGSDRISSYPVTSSTFADKLPENEVETGARGATEAPEGWTSLVVDGIQMNLPADWQPQETDDGWSWSNPEHSVVGNLYSVGRLDVYSYDVEAMTSAIPASLERAGYSSIAVITNGSQHSSSGTLCSARLMLSANYEGESCILYYQFVLSRSHLNVIEFRGLSNAFAGNMDQIAKAAESVQFVRGQEI